MYPKFQCIIKLYAVEAKQQIDGLVYFGGILLNIMQK